MKRPRHSVPNSVGSDVQPSSEYQDLPHPKPASVRILLFRSNINLSHLTFAVFELPDELILSILSYISPDPQLTDIGRYARFRVQYGMVVDGGHQQRVRFLLHLSMTCMAMRFRLLPWVWERLECLELVPSWSSDGRFPRKLNAIMKALDANASLATSVRYFCALLCLSVGADLCPLKVRDGARVVE